MLVPSPVLALPLLLALRAGLRLLLLLLGRARRLLRSLLLALGQLLGAGRRRRRASCIGCPAVGALLSHSHAAAGYRGACWPARLHAWAAGLTAAIHGLSRGLSHENTADDALRAQQRAAMRC